MINKYERMIKGAVKGLQEHKDDPRAFELLLEGYVATIGEVISYSISKDDIRTDILCAIPHQSMFDIFGPTWAVA